jgi:4-aminobutyrate aminotransferase-like enzyme
MSRMKNDRTMVNAFVPGQVPLSAEETRMVERRQKLLGPAYRLFYQHPLHLVRGEDVWLHASDGRKYLDAYNNVASIGHCHPHVVQAIAKQTAILSTNTRYLGDAILDYAERLLSTMPDALQHVMFTCTGSEANDLAVRLARDFTGHEGFIVSDNAYHGVTDAVSAMSPSLGSGVPLGKHVRTVPAPIGDGSAFAAGVEAAIADLGKAGVKPAALMVDTIFSSDGVFPGPDGFLKDAVEAVRRAGGVFIADEVQPGFGRTGAGMWGFARHGLEPELVSLGKPMGNGYPVAGLVMQPKIVAGFGARARYFNTFGGNSVAIAAASAVLDVIENQGLIENARKVGTIFMDGIKGLAAPQMGEVRGKGLFVGVDILRDGAADGAEASRIVNGMREAGILISATGPRGHTLKIRPPLTFTAQHAELFVSTLGKVMRA